MKSLSGHVQHLPCPKRGESRDPLIFYSNRVLLLFFLAMTITFRCSQETNTDYLPCFCCVVNSILEGKQKADCKCLNWSPSNSYLRKCKQEASCKCLTWSPSISSFTGTWFLGQEDRAGDKGRCGYIFLLLTWGGGQEHSHRSLPHPHPALLQLPKST